MDANGTRFHLLLGRDDWGRCRDGDGQPIRPYGQAGGPVAYDTDRNELTLRPLPFLFRPPGAPVLTPADRRGSARDRYGNWYWIDRTRTALLVNSAGSGATTAFWPDASAPAGQADSAGGFAPTTPAEPPATMTLAGAAVTDDHYLVVGVTAPAGLLVFDLQGGGGPDRFEWPAGVPFTPYDLTARPGGGVYVLDRDQRRYWELDRTFRPVPRTNPSPPPTGGGFEPAGGPLPNTGTPCPPAVPPTDAEAIPVTDGGSGAPADPIGVEATPDGTLLVLFAARAGFSSTVRPYREGVAPGPAVPLTDPAGGLLVAGHDLALVPAAPDPARPEALGLLFVADRGGDQAFAFTATLGAAGLGLTVTERYHPMRLYAGRGLVAAAGQAYYDFAGTNESGDRWLPLVAQPRPRYAGVGTVVTPVLDGGEPACRWHRLMLDACLPSETTVRVWSAASDDPAALATDPDWLAEPTPYARGDGSELPYVDTPTAYRTWELAFQQARGRYLRLRLELTGNERSSPRLRAMRAYYPRFSYLDQYLPAIYREEPAAASFLDRYLANLEGIYTTVEDRIANAQILLDPRTTPAEALEWLGDWVALAMDPAWGEAKRRLVVGHAMEFFQWRGTVRGLRTAVALAVEDRPTADLFADRPSACALRTRIVERYQTKLTPGVAYGDPTQVPVTPAPGGRWRPADGAEALHERYRTALLIAGLPAPEGTRFPTVAPADPADPTNARRLEAWRQVATGALGVVPVAGEGDAWRGFLARRYPLIGDYNTAYARTGPAAARSYDELQPPTVVSDREPGLTDWFQFQTVVVPGRRAAHRFRVLLPVAAGTRADPRVPDDAADRATRLDLVRRVVELEKPAHTTFDVKFYWDAFRVGEARLGLDTLVDLGGRSPNLRPDAVLGRAYVGESVLASPIAAQPRAIRDPLSNGCP